MQILAVDSVPERLQLALSCGASQAFDFTQVDACRAVKDATEGQGVDIALEVR